MKISGTIAVLLFSSLATFGSLANASSLVADVTMNPAGDFKAKTNDVIGEAVQDGDTFKADLITVKLQTLDCGMTIRTRHAKEKYLEVAKYPEAVLTKAVGQGGKGKANLKFHGVEHAIEGTYKVDGGMLKADFPIKLSDFNIKSISYLGQGVEDEVQIHVSVPIKKKGAGPAPASVQKAKPKG